MVASCKYLANVTCSMCLYLAAKGKIAGRGLHWQEKRLVEKVRKSLKHSEFNGAKMSMSELMYVCLVCAVGFWEEG